MKVENQKNYNWLFNTDIEPFDNLPYGLDEYLRLYTEMSDYIKSRSINVNIKLMNQLDQDEFKSVIPLTFATENNEYHIYPINTENGALEMLSQVLYIDIYKETLKKRFIPISSINKQEIIDIFKI